MSREWVGSIGKLWWKRWNFSETNACSNLCSEYPKLQGLLIHVLWDWKFAVSGQLRGRDFVVCVLLSVFCWKSSVLAPCFGCRFVGWWIWCSGKSFMLSLRGCCGKLLGMPSWKFSDAARTLSFAGLAFSLSHFWELLMHWHYSLLFYYCSGVVNTGNPLPVTLEAFLLFGILYPLIVHSVMNQ